MTTNGLSRAGLIYLLHSLQLMGDVAAPGLILAEFDRLKRRGRRKTR